MFEWPHIFFVTGTDTDIGKTFISAILTAGLDACYWKPIQSGSIDGTDTDFVKNITGLNKDRFIKELVKLPQPLSPHAAAEAEGLEIDHRQLILPSEELLQGRRLVIEGAGGLMVPINWKYFMIDLIKKWQLPVVLVAKSGLGTLNHTLLSIEALQIRGIPIFGLVMNGEPNESNRVTIERLSGLQVIAEVPPIQNPEGMNFKELFEEYFKKN